MKRASGALLTAARALGRGSLSKAQAVAEAQPAAQSRSIKQATLPVALPSRGFAATAVPAEAEVQVASTQAWPQGVSDRLYCFLAGLTKKFTLQAPLTLHGSEGRYASALYCAAARTGDLDAVDDDMCGVS